MTRKERKSYRKPEIKQVRLMSEQAVLATCKTAGGIIADCVPPDLACIGSTAAS